MDTPEKSQRAKNSAPSGVEDSPVFNFLNNLSPIQTVKSTHIAQTVHSLSFGALPSIFTSPYINKQKEPKLVARYPLADQDANCPSKDISSIVKRSYQLDITLYDKGLEFPLSDTSGNRTEQCSTLQSESLQYGHGSCSHEMAPSNKFVMGSTSLIEFVHDGMEEDQNQILPEVELKDGHQSTQPMETEICDWNSFLPDNSDDLLIFDSFDAFGTPKGQGRIVGKHVAGVATADARAKDQGDESLAACHQNASHDLLSDLSEKYSDKNELDRTTIVSFLHHDKQIMDQSSRKMDVGSTKADFPLQQSMLRRCLTFEAAMTQKKDTINDSHQGTFFSDIRHAGPSKSGSGKVTCVLPGIGLHLNTLASASKDRLTKHIVPYEKSRGLNPSPGSLASQSSAKITLHSSLSAEKKSGDELPQDLSAIQDGPSGTEIEKIEELNLNTQKKKKLRVENSSDSESCKRCNCKKSKCLKLYCECFAAGVYCLEPCACQGCMNKPQHEDTVLATRKQIESRNPLAFAPKVIVASKPEMDETNKTPASARHKRGCNCKKSNCLKKYCECYQGGAGCSLACRCEGCKNTFGRKPGTMHIGISEIDHDQGELGGNENKKPDNVQNLDAHNNKHNISEGLPTTPSLLTSRMHIMPFSSGKPPRYSTLGVGSSSHTFNISKAPAKCESSCSQVKLSIGTPDVLGGIKGAKVVSPSRKRISPPSSEASLYPGRKGSRKVILQSIPPFPCLAFEANDEPPKI